ncbi:hypothetical protein ACEV7Y_23890, partial [Vibrio parahaemolyticus]
MGSDYDENNPRKTRQSNTPIAGLFFVVKDHNQDQLQAPMPHEAKLWLDELTSTDKIEPVVVPK